MMRLSALNNEEKKEEKVGKSWKHFMKVSNMKKMLLDNQ